MIEYTNPKYWGPHFWFTMRCLAFNYSEYPASIEKKAYMDYYNSLQYILPCKKCRYNYRKLLEKYPVEDYLYKKAALMEWVEMIYQMTESEMRSNLHHECNLPKRECAPKHRNFPYFSNFSPGSCALRKANRRDDDIERFKVKYDSDNSDDSCGCGH